MSNSKIASASQSDERSDQNLSESGLKNHNCNWYLLLHWTQLVSNEHIF